MSKFKVGDKVKILNNIATPLRVGSVHHVSSIGNWGVVGIKVGFKTWLFGDKFLELIEEKEVQKKYKIEVDRNLLEAKAMSGWLKGKTYLPTLVMELGDIIKESERKVVVIGDSKYYEDELQTALANIKPIQ